jgi:hypothetical protein
MRWFLVVLGTIVVLTLAVNGARTEQPTPPFLDPPAIDVHPSHEAALQGKVGLKDFVADGERLFRTVFNTRDGVGRPNATGDSKPTIRQPPARAFQRIAGPDASSCADCHNSPLIGGSGGLATNVFVGAHFTDPPTSTVSDAITNERNTITIFGAGAVEMVAREMTEELQRQKTEAVWEAQRRRQDVRRALEAKGVHFGTLVAHPDGTYDRGEIEGVDMDLVVKPFGVKGVAVSLREFTNFALNQHHGIQSEERFGWARTGIVDFDGDSVTSEMTVGQVSALALYQASLPAPRRVRDVDESLRLAAGRGERVFREIGCASCHVPALPLRSAWFLEPSPYNRPGSAVPADVGGQLALPLIAEDDSGLFRDDRGRVFAALFSDLKRHVICDEQDPFFCNETIKQDFVPTDQFLTAKLWDAGTSAPYGHRGDVTTISEAIAHHSAEGREAKQRFQALSDDDKVGVVRFLQSLRVVDTQQQAAKEALR